MADRLAKHVEFPSTLRGTVGVRITKDHDNIKATRIFMMPGIAIMIMAKGMDNLTVTGRLCTIMRHAAQHHDHQYDPSSAGVDAENDRSIAKVILALRALNFSLAYEKDQDSKHDGTISWTSARRATMRECDGIEVSLKEDILADVDEHIRVITITARSPEQ